MRFFSLVFPALLISFLSGCASVPVETVDISTKLGQQLQSLNQSHVSYINLFYDQIDSRANRWIDEIYAPEIISAQLGGKTGAILLRAIDAAKKGDEDAKDAVTLLTRYLEQVKKAIDIKRNELLSPVQQARKKALASVEIAWGQATLMNVTLTNYLQSLSKLRQSQDQLLAQVGASDLQDQAAEKISSISNNIDQILNDAKDHGANLEELTKRVEVFIQSVR